MSSSIRSGPYTRLTCLNPRLRLIQTIGIPSGVTMPAALWIRISSGSRCDSITP